MDFKNMLDFLFRATPNRVSQKPAEAEKETPQTIKAKLNTARSGADYYEDYMSIKAGHYYILEIVRPYTKEMRDKYALDGTRNVNGSYRIVSTQKMYVSRVVAHSNKLELDCRGVDNYGRRDDRTYTFYQTPDSLNQRDTYILSIKKA